MHVLACNPTEVLTLPRRYRLTRREGFTRILQQRAQTNLWFAVHSEINSAGHSRLGMTVSKRILPAATRRNATKRLIRECFRGCAREGGARDVVIRLRKPIPSEERPAARAALGKLLKTILATE